MVPRVPWIAPFGPRWSSSSYGYECLRYFVREWPESRGDVRDGWGVSRWFFEADDQGVVIRQVEVYANGPTLRYDLQHHEDAYGRLSEKPLDLDEFRAFETDAKTFNAAWSH
jgi:hypothetical protein